MKKGGNGKRGGGGGGAKKKHNKHKNTTASKKKKAQHKQQHQQHQHKGQQETLLLKETEGTTQQSGERQGPTTHEQHQQHQQDATATVTATVTAAAAAKEARRKELQARLRSKRAALRAGHGHRQVWADRDQAHEHQHSSCSCCDDHDHDHEHSTSSGNDHDAAPDRDGSHAAQDHNASYTKQLPGESQAETGASHLLSTSSKKALSGANRHAAPRAMPDWLTGKAGDIMRAQPESHDDFLQSLPSISNGTNPFFTRMMARRKKGALKEQQHTQSTRDKRLQPMLFDEELEVPDVEPVLFPDDDANLNLQTDNFFAVTPNATNSDRIHSDDDDGDDAWAMADVRPQRIPVHTARKPSTAGDGAGGNEMSLRASTLSPEAKTTNAVTVAAAGTTTQSTVNGSSNGRSDDEAMALLDQFMADVLLDAKYNSNGDGGDGVPAGNATVMTVTTKGAQASMVAQYGDGGGGGGDGGDVIVPVRRNPHSNNNYDDDDDDDSGKEGGEGVENDDGGDGPGSGDDDDDDDLFGISPPQPSSTMLHILGDGACSLLPGEADDDKRFPAAPVTRTDRFLDFKSTIRAHATAQIAGGELVTFTAVEGEDTTTTTTTMGDGAVTTTTTTTTTATHRQIATTTATAHDTGSNGTTSSAGSTAIDTQSSPSPSVSASAVEAFALDPDFDYDDIALTATPPLHAQVAAMARQRGGGGGDR